MFCSKCGAENSNIAKYCEKCGEGLVKINSPHLQEKPKNKRSTLRIIGASLVILGGLLSLCFLVFDMALSVYTSPDQMDIQEQIMNASMYRLGFVFITIILSIICVALKRPSRIISIILLVISAITAFSPWLMGSVGGLFGTVFLIFGTIGAVSLVVDSFINFKAS